MEETVTSIFDDSYYSRAICGAVVLLCLTGFMLYNTVSGYFGDSVGAYIFTACLCGAVWLYYRFFSKAWTRLIVNAEGIIAQNVVFRTETRIAYTEITGFNTYRSRGQANRWRNGFSADFVIEYGADKWISFNEAWYQNYSKLTMAIYLHKYGPGHGRDRYLARHGGA